MRCEYCNYCETAPNLIQTTFGKGRVQYYGDIDRHLCDECAIVSFELTLATDEEDND